MDWPTLVAGLGGAVMGALTSEALTRQRGTKAEVRRELEKTRHELAVAKEQTLLLNAQIFALNTRVDDLLHRLDHERKDP